MQRIVYSRALPEHSPHVALAEGAGLPHHALEDAVLCLVLVVEVTVAVVSAVVPQDLNGGPADLRLELRGGNGDGGQAGEDDLRNRGSVKREKNS